MQDDGESVAGKPEVVVEEIDFGGLSLLEFANAKDEVSVLPPTVDTYSAQSIDECMFFLLNTGTFQALIVFSSRQGERQTRRLAQVHIGNICLHILPSPLLT